LADILKALPQKSKKVFIVSTDSIRATFIASRKRTSIKLKNPRLLQIHFHTFRYWKATTLYHQTKDIIYVQTFLGHKSIQNTMKYIQLENVLFKEDSDKFMSKVAENVEVKTFLISYTQLIDRSKIRNFSFLKTHVIKQTN